MSEIVSKSDSIQGIVSDVIYRGEDIFSILLKSGENQEIPNVSINLIDCVSFQDQGIVGESIQGINIDSLSMRFIFIAQKFGLSKNDYKSLCILTSSNKTCWAMIRDIVISENINLYNPISEDKFKS